MLCLFESTLSTVIYSCKTQALSLSSGTYWQWSLCVPVVEQPVGWPPSQCSAFLRLISCLFRAQVSLQWTTGWPGRSKSPTHKEALYVSGSQAPREEAWPHFEWDTHSVPRQQGAHLFDGRLGFRPRCARVIGVAKAVCRSGRCSSSHSFTTGSAGCLFANVSPRRLSTLWRA